MPPEKIEAVASCDRVRIPRPGPMGPPRGCALARLSPRLRAMIARRPWGDLAEPAPAPGATDSPSAGPADVLVLGLPWDGSVCMRPGAAEAPAALRAVSSSSMAISERGELVRRDDLRVVDLGDLAPDDPADRSEEGRRRYLDRVERETARHLKAAARRC